MDDLLNALENNSGEDLLVPYSQIATLFPSQEPHQDSFDYKVIDIKSLRSWAESNGWSVTTAPDQTPPNAPASPPIRFRRI